MDHLLFRELMMHTKTKIRSVFPLAATTTLILIAGMAPVYGGVVLKDYAAAKSSEGFKQYLTGVGAGFQQANAELQLRRMKKLYCPPPNAELQFEAYTDMLEKEVKDNPAFYSLETPVESALLFGLMKTYPCR
jgi:hypothetical protein